MDLQTALTEIGFTEYEAKVYLALLRENPANGYQISKKSGVPRSMVYEALGRLSTRGAVLETIEDRATLYRPLPPEMLLDRHQKEHKRLLTELREGLQTLYTAPEEEHVWSFSGRQTVHAYATQMIREAESELYMVLNDADLLALHETIAEANGRGVAIGTLLTGKGRLEYGQTSYHSQSESEIQEMANTLIVVADNREALIASTGSEATASTTTNRKVVMRARQFVWTELLTQRIYARLGSDLLALLAPEDRQLFESMGKGGAQ
jgi:HTH-type transcriptional regulator, sugar sensing transcriptional regulator